MNPQDSSPLTFKSMLVRFSAVLALTAIFCLAASAVAALAK